MKRPATTRRLFGKAALLSALALAAALLPHRVAADADFARFIRRPVDHGRDLFTTYVGIRGAKIAAIVPSSGQAANPAHPGLSIRDDTVAPFLQRIGQAASYDGYAVPGPHLLIENATFTGALDISAKLPLVLRGVSVRVAGAAYWAVLSRVGAGPLHVLWSDIGGAPGIQSAKGQPGVQRGLYLESDNALVYRSHISGTADGIQVHAQGARIVETVIDDLVTWAGEHNDGIQVIGRGERLTVQRSRIVNPHPQTSCLLLQRGGHLIEDNFLSGGGWVIYGGATAKPPNIEAARNVRISGNDFGQGYFKAGGHFGAIADWDGRAATGNVWRDNRFVDGKAVKLPIARP